MKKTCFLLVLILCFSCENSSIPLPKPPTYLRLNLPMHTYKEYVSPCGYRFAISQLYTIKDVYDTLGNITCHKDIHLGVLNGTVHVSYIEMKEPVATYINFANNKVDEHKVKASAIEDQQVIRQKDKVYGTFFELQGDVASPFQFYLTDSVSKFVSGIVYFNSRPNYDSLKPTLDYLKIDLLKMVNTFNWR